MLLQDPARSFWISALSCWRNLGVFLSEGACFCVCVCFLFVLGNFQRRIIFINWLFFKQKNKKKTIFIIPFFIPLAGKQGTMGPGFLWDALFLFVSYEREGPFVHPGPCPHGAASGSGGGSGRRVGTGTSTSCGVTSRVGQSGLSVQTGAFPGATGVPVPSCGRQSVVLPQYDPPRTPLPQQARYCAHCHQPDALSHTWGPW